MKKSKIFLEFYKVLKTNEEDILVLPWGNSKPEVVLDWITSLNEEEFNELMNLPIINQAKLFYTKIWNKYNK